MDWQFNLRQQFNHEPQVNRGLILGAFACHYLVSEICKSVVSVQ